MAGDRISPSLAGLVERDDLIAEIVEQQARVVTRGGCLVWLSGEAGVGKTSVVRAVAGRLRTRILTGACDAMTTPRPLGPLLDMAATGGHRIAQALAADASRHGLFEALLDELSSPTLVVIEDVHWADEGTVDMLRFIGRRVAQTRSVVLVTYRSDELDAHPDLRIALGDLAAAPACRRLEVAPLSLDGVRTMAEGHALDASRLHDVTGGNPFFVTEVLSTQTWSVPRTVADAVLARASRLSAEAGSAIDIVSIEPAGMEWWLAEQLGADPDALQQAIGAGMLTLDGELLRFRHELARLAIAARQRADRRVALHETALTELAGRDAEPARLTQHAERSHNTIAVARWAPIAARRADAAGAHREAAAQYERAVAALEVSPDTAAERCRLLFALADQLAMIDRLPQSLGACEQMLAIRERLGDLTEIAMARAYLARALWRTGRGDEAYAAIALATDEIDDVPDLEGIAQRAFVLTMRAYLDMLGRRATSIAFADRAIAVAQSCADLHCLSCALNARGSARIVLAGDAGGVDDLRRSISVGAQNGSDKDVSDALLNLGSGLGEVRRMEFAGQALEEAVRHATAHDLDGNRRYSQAWLARVRFEQGRWDEADILNTAEFDREDINGIAVIVSMTVRGRLRARRGLPAVAGELDRAWRLAIATQDVQRLWPVVAARVEVAWLTDTVDDRIRSDLVSVMQQAVGTGMRHAVGELVWWAWKLGIEPGPLPDEAAEGYSLHVAGDLAGAAAWWQRLGAPYEAAMALADTNEESSLRDALDRFIALGATPMAQRVRRRLRELGARDIPRGPQSSTTASPDGLTRREVDVLALLADGLTNREIASRLHLSVRTVGHHVGAILRKLDVRTRTEAAVAFAAHGHNN